MTVQDIIALSGAGFTPEQISAFAPHLRDAAEPEKPAQQTEPNPQVEPERPDPQQAENNPFEGMQQQFAQFLNEMRQHAFAITPNENPNEGMTFEGIAAHILAPNNKKGGM